MMLIKGAMVIMLVIMCQPGSSHDQGPAPLSHSVKQEDEVLFVYQAIMDVIKHIKVLISLFQRFMPKKTCGLSSSSSGKLMLVTPSKIPKLLPSSTSLKISQSFSEWQSSLLSESSDTPKFSITPAFQTYVDNQLRSSKNFIKELHMITSTRVSFATAFISIWGVLFNIMHDGHEENARSLSTLKVPKASSFENAKPYCIFSKKKDLRNFTQKCFSELSNQIESLGKLIGTFTEQVRPAPVDEVDQDGDASMNVQLNDRDDACSTILWGRPVPNSPTRQLNDPVAFDLCNNVDGSCQLNTATSDVNYNEFNQDSSIMDSMEAKMMFDAKVVAHSDKANPESFDSLSSHSDSVLRPCRKPDVSSYGSLTGHNSRGLGLRLVKKYEEEIALRKPTVCEGDFDPSQAKVVNSKEISSMKACDEQSFERNLADPIWLQQELFQLKLDYFIKLDQCDKDALEQSNELARVKASHEAKIALAEELSTKFKKLKSDYDNEVALREQAVHEQAVQLSLLRDNHQKEVADLRQCHQSSLEQVEKMRVNDLASIRQKHEAEVQNVRNECQNLRQSFENQLKFCKIQVESARKRKLPRKLRSIGMENTKNEIAPDKKRRLETTIAKTEATAQKPVGVSQDNSGGDGERKSKIVDAVVEQGKSRRIIPFNANQRQETEHSIADRDYDDEFAIRLSEKTGAASFQPNLKNMLTAEVNAGKLGADPSEGFCPQGTINDQDQRKCCDKNDDHDYDCASTKVHTDVGHKIEQGDINFVIEDRRDGKQVENTVLRGDCGTDRSTDDYATLNTLREEGFPRVCYEPLAKEQLQKFNQFKVDNHGDVELRKAIKLSEEKSNVLPKLACDNEKEGANQEPPVHEVAMEAFQRRAVDGQVAAVKTSDEPTPQETLEELKWLRQELFELKNNYFYNLARRDIDARDKSIELSRVQASYEAKTAIVGEILIKFNKLLSEEAVHEQAMQEIVADFIQGHQSFLEHVGQATTEGTAQTLVGVEQPDNQGNDDLNPKSVNTAVEQDRKVISQHLDVNQHQEAEYSNAYRQDDNEFAVKLLEESSGSAFSPNTRTGKSVNDPKKNSCLGGITNNQEHRNRCAEEDDYDRAFQTSQSEITETVTHDIEKTNTICVDGGCRYGEQIMEDNGGPVMVSDGDMAQSTTGRSRAENSINDELKAVQPNSGLSITNHFFEQGPHPDTVNDITIIRGDQEAEIVAIDGDFHPGDTLNQDTIGNVRLSPELMSGTGSNGEVEHDILSNLRVATEQTPTPVPSEKTPISQQAGNDNPPKKGSGYVLVCFLASSVFLIFMCLIMFYAKRA